MIKVSNIFGYTIVLFCIVILVGMEEFPNLSKFCCFVLAHNVFLSFQGVEYT